MIIALTALTLVTGVNAEAKSVKTVTVDGGKWEVTTTKKKIVAKPKTGLTAEQLANFHNKYTVKAYKDEKDLDITYKLKKGLDKSEAGRIINDSWKAYEDESIGLVSVAGITVQGDAEACKWHKYSGVSCNKNRKSFEQRMAYRRVVRRFYDDNNGFAGMSEFDKTYAAIELVQKGCYYTSSYGVADAGGWIKFENAVYNGGRKLACICSSGSEMAAILMESTGLSKGSCGVASSEDLNHAWNFLLLDGKMYFASWQTRTVMQNYEKYNSQEPEIKAWYDGCADDDDSLGEDVRAARSMSKGMYGWTYEERSNSSLYKQTDIEYHCAIKNGKHVGYSDAWMSGHEDKAHKLTYKF